MKRILAIAILTLMVFHFSSCEKDDICVEGDTPLLVLGFFDQEDPENEKNVPSLRILAFEPITTISSFNDRTNVDSIGVPLRIDTNATSFLLITNSADDEDGMETGNIDTLTFNYEVNEEFISRACGFIANYNAIDTIRQVSSENWIQKIEIIEPDVTRSNAIHVKIFH